MLDDFLVPPSPSHNILQNAAHVLCCKVVSTLSSCHLSVIAVPMSRPVFRHLFPVLVPCAPSHTFHRVLLSSLNPRLFDRRCFKKLNCHGQGSEVQDLDVKHRIVRIVTGFLPSSEGKLTPQPADYMEEIFLKITKKICQLSLVSIIRENE